MNKKELDKIAEEFVKEKKFFDSLREREKNLESLKKTLLIALTAEGNHIVTKNYNLNRIVNQYTVYNVPAEIKEKYKGVGERQTLQIVPAK